MGWLILIFKFKFHFKVKIYPILSLRVCPRDNLLLIEVRISKFWPRCILALLRSLLMLELIDLDLQFFCISNQLSFLQAFRLSFICIVVYIFSEAIASECSTSHMAPHIYWFPWMRTGSRHGPWNSLPLYLGETFGVSASLDSTIGTGFYKLLSVFAILYTLRISKLYMPTLINHRNNSKTAPISLYFVPVSTWGTLPQSYF